MNFRTLWIALMLLLCYISAEAGSAPASWSKVPGVLLGFSHEGMGGLRAYIGSRHSKEFIDKFKNACRKKSRVWALGTKNVFVCTKLKYIKEAGNGPVYELQLSTKDKNWFTKHAVVLSLETLSPYKPDMRNLETSEVKSLLSVYESSSLKRAVRNAINTGNVRVLDFNKNLSSIYIVKWKHVVESEYSSNDHFLVINRNGENFFSSGNFEGDIVGFVDVNNDGIPEVQRSIGCDGTCEAVTSIYRNTEDLVSVYNH